MKEHVDDAPMRFVEKLWKDDMKIADARAWRLAFKAWKKSLTRAGKGPRAYESIADLSDWVRRNEVPPLNSANNNAALGRDVSACGSAWKGSSSSNSFAIFKGGLGPRFLECYLRSFMGDKVLLPPVHNAPCGRFVALEG
eukprot:jgi/Tetstr1/461130/TSEL_006269.t1